MASKKPTIKRTGKNRNLRKRMTTYRLLFNGCSDEHEDATSRQAYDPLFHPKDVVRFYRERYDQMEDPKFFRSKNKVEWVTKPVRPPSAAAYAAEIGVRRETLWAWEKQYDEFAEAMSIAKAIQEAMLVELGVCGAYNPSSVNFALKNLQGWTDRLEQTNRGTVALQFDSQDSEA